MHLANLVRQLVWEYVWKGRAQTDKMTVIKASGSTPMSCIGIGLMSLGGCEYLMSRLCAQHPGEVVWSSNLSPRSRGGAMNNHAGPSAQTQTVLGNPGYINALPGTLNSPRNPLSQTRILDTVAALTIWAFMHKKSWEKGGDNLSSSYHSC